MAGELPGVPSTMTLPGHSSLCRRYSEVKHLLKELDRLIEAALERILQPTPGNGSENVSPPLDLELWNQIPLVLIDEHDKDNPIILDIFETNQAAGGNETATGNKTSVSNDTAEDYQSSTTTGNEATTPPALANTTTGNETTAPPAPANTTSEEKKYKLAVKLVRGVPQWQRAGMRDGCLGKDTAGRSVTLPHQLPMVTLPWGSGLAVPRPSPCCRLSPGQSLPWVRPPKCQGEAVAAAPIPFLLRSTVQRHMVVLQPLTPAPMEAPRTLPEQTLEAGAAPALKNWPKSDIFC